MSGTAIDWPTQLNQHRSWLMSVLRSRINNPHVVDDLYQEVSLAVLRQAARPTDPDKVAPWLYRLAIRHSINFHRKTGRQRRLQQKLEHLAVTETPSSSDALDWLVQNEQRATVSKAIRQLRPQDREILTLKYSENWTYKQLAEHLGASTNTIEYRLIRARKQLRKYLCELNVIEQGPN